MSATMLNGSRMVYLNLFDIILEGHVQVLIKRVTDNHRIRVGDSKTILIQEHSREFFIQNDSKTSGRHHTLRIVLRLQRAYLY